MISGIPSSGKTTYSRELANLLSIDTIIEVDYIYFDIAKKLEIEDYRSFANIRKWADTDKLVLSTLKREHYNNYLLPHKDKNSLIIEGYALFCKEDRDIIKEILQPKEIIFINKEANYQQWLEFKNKNCVKLDCDKTKHEFEDLMNVRQKISDNENIKVVSVK